MKDASHKGPALVVLLLGRINWRRRNPQGTNPRKMATGTTRAYCPNGESKSNRENHPQDVEGKKRRADGYS